MKVFRLCTMLLIGMCAKSATITAVSTQAAYSVGDSVTVDVTVSNVTDLFAFQFDLLFDSAVLSAQSVAETGYFLSNGVSFAPGVIDNTAGTITLIADSLTGSTPGVNGSAALVIATFSAIGAGTASVTPAHIILLDSNLSEIPATAAGASIQVSGSPSSAPEASSYTLAGIGLLSLPLLLRRRRGCASGFAACPQAQIQQRAGSAIEHSIKAQSSVL